MSDDKYQRCEAEEWRVCAEKLAEELIRRKPRGVIPPLEAVLAVAEFKRLRRKYLSRRFHS